MAIEAKARIVIVGGPQALKTVQGVSRETKKAGNEAKKSAMDQARAAKASADAQLKAARQAAAEGQRIEKAKLKEIEKQHRDAARAIGKFAQAITKEARREAAKQVKIAEQTARAQAKAADVARRDRGRKGAWLIGGATAGVLAGGASAMNTGRGVAGVDDVRTRVQKANDFRERLIVTTSQAGMTPEERERVQGQVKGASRASGKDAGELMGVLEGGQAQFNDLRFYADHLKELAVMAKAAGGDTSALARAVGFMKQAFGLSGEEAMVMANKMVAASAEGSIELKNFAEDFTDSMGLFAETTGLTGMAGASQFIGVAQAGGSLGAGSAKTSTMLERFTADLADTNVRLKLDSALKTKTKGMSPQTLIEKMVDSKKFTPEKLQKIFPEENSRKMVTALMSARSRVLANDTGAYDIGSIAGVDAASGEKLTADTMAAMESDGLLDLQRQAIDMQNDTITKLKDYNSQVLLVTEAANRLEKSFGTLSLWSDSISTGGMAGAGTSLLGSLLGSSAAAGAAGAGGAAAAGAGGVMAAGALTVGAGVLAAGMAGYGIGTAINKWTGASDAIAKWLTPGVDEARDRLNEDAVMPGKGAGATPAVDPKAPWTVANDPQLLNEMRAQTRELKKVAEALDRRAPPTTNPNVRGMML